MYLEIGTAYAADRAESVLYCLFRYRENLILVRPPRKLDRFVVRASSKYWVTPSIPT